MDKPLWDVLGNTKSTPIALNSTYKYFLGNEYNLYQTTSSTTHLTSFGVLLGQPSMSFGCATLLWALSVSFLGTAIILVIVIGIFLPMTPWGFKFVFGRDNTKKVMRQLRAQSMIASRESLKAPLTTPPI
eukprot:TRINITY_DN4644_c0_g2_i2.p1 TRINITY_DN4644_c0_g2~~TRINITY_DN4644_c0_g2_i2.p1  ORF type:complete len:130 (-),score=35.47 TRINITY_DN4644_c0_g2_i2:100-489(-)